MAEPASPGIYADLDWRVPQFIVMAVNGGRMPVSVEASAVLGPYYVDMLREGGAVSKHYMMDASTHLSFLGDIIPLSSPYPRTQVISIGDVVMNIGIFLFIQYMMVNRSGKAAAPATSIRPEEIRTDSKEGRSFP